MTSTPMVETIAMALAAKHVARERMQLMQAEIAVPGSTGLHVGSLERDIEKAWPHYVEDAIAALSALSTPTEGMKQMGDWQLRNWAGDGAAAQVFTAMIQAALSEGEA